MPIDEFNPVFLSDSESKEIATRQLLSFLSVTEEESQKRAPSKKLFSLSKIPTDAITDAPLLFKWKSRPIYDVDGVLLFWDQSIELDDANSLTVRTAASDLLRTPVWSVRAGEKQDLDTLISKAREALGDSPELEPVLVDHETTPRMICYAYPRLGMLAASRTQPSVRFILDLWERKPIPVEKPPHGAESEPREESVSTIWSPYDLVTRATVDRFRARFRRQRGSLPRLPTSPEQLRPAVAAARATIEELTTDPELSPKIGQTKSSFCAPATMQMILRHHHVNKTQRQIADEMDTTPDGTRPEDQADAVDNLTSDTFVGLLDKTTSFTEAKDEIRANRPFKTGDIGHARACCGFMIETNIREWLYIYDPLPVDAGDIYFESWEANYHWDYIYVRPSPSM
jgi:hypothetical protein